MPSILTYQERVAVARLHALLELLPTALDHELIPVGMTSFEYTLLDSLADAPEHFLRLTELAARTNATLPRLSRVVSSLEKRGWLERVRCPSDARATNAFITDAGVRARETAQPVYGSAVRRLVLAGFDSDGIKKLADVCLTVLQKLDPQEKLTATTSQLDRAVDPESAACTADPQPEPCAADPAPTCAADPAPICAADPHTI